MCNCEEESQESHAEAFWEAQCEQEDHEFDEDDNDYENNWEDLEYDDSPNDDEFDE